MISAPIDIDARPLLPLVKQFLLSTFLLPNGNIMSKIVERILGLILFAYLSPELLG